jgi:Flp pilus assembly pilin Flp
MSQRLQLKQRQRGQGMTEYIIIVALIAIGAIAVYQYFGNTVRNQTAAIAEELGGSTGEAQKNAAAIQAGRAAADAATERNLSNYTDNKNR